MDTPLLKSDNRAIFTAAAQAQCAADYQHSLQPKPEPLPDPVRGLPTNGLQNAPNRLSA